MATETEVYIIYCGGESPQLPEPYTPVIAFLRERRMGELIIHSIPCLHTGSYDPVRKEAGLPSGVWVTVISGAVVNPVAWLDLTGLSGAINQEFLRRLEKEVKIKLAEVG